MLNMRQIFSSRNASSIWWTIPQRNASKASLLKKAGLTDVPKKPSNRFILYSMVMRPQIQEHNPKMSPQEIVCEIARRWHKEPESEKAKYENHFKVNMETYRTELDKFNESLTDVVKEQVKELAAKEEITKVKQRIVRKLKKEEREFKKPKHPGSGFQIYMQKTCGMSRGVESVKEGSEMWKNLSEKERDMYSAERKKQFAKYKEDLLKWEEEMLLEGKIDLVRLKTIREKLQSCT